MLRQVFVINIYLITLGCNQAFFELVLAICDPNDEIIVIKPYYFNHMMALQLSNVIPVIVDIGFLTSQSNKQVIRKEKHNLTNGLLVIHS